MSSTLQKITTRAKAIRKAHPSKKWTDCIKAASRELRGKATAPAKRKKAPRKKIGAAKANRQTGSSNLKRDKQKTAKSPGKRVVKHRGSASTVYYERRKNRSDKPGSLSGISAATIKKHLRDRLEDKLGKEFVHKLNATTKRAKTKIQKTITATKAELRKLK